MNKTLKRSLALILVLVMCIASLPMLHIDTHAETVDYVYGGNYIYNWGERGETATFLSQNAEAFYTGSNTYDVFSALSGASGTAASTSALYSALKTFMSSKQTHITNYDETKNLFRYTDCQNSGGKISSFYSGAAIGPAWGEGNWNREHTWPNSKGEGSAENDIMMLRPTATSENSSRGNTAYGKSSGYYNPNSESGGQYDLRGDVARIVLYVYVRWGNTQYAWGKSGVMESPAVLLEWMEADPVDTWELGRNDSVESITGARNVFVDYPELAFLLFNEEIPTNMPTPSGASAECEHNNFDAGVTVPATCTSSGYVLLTCQTAGCGCTKKTNVVAATGHSYTAGVCTKCGDAEPVKPVYTTSPAVNTAYKLGLNAGGTDYFFTGTIVNQYYGATDADFSKGVDVFVETVSGGYRLYFNSGSQKQYINLVVNGTHRNFTFSTTATTVFTWDSAKSSFKTELEGEDVYIGNYGSHTSMATLSQSKIQSTDYFARLYTMGGSGNTGSGDSGSTGGNPGDSGSTGGNQGGTSGGDPGSTACQHSYAAVVTPPTCTAGGYTTYTCSKCQDSYVGAQTAATGHSYKDGECIGCGAAKPSSGGSGATVDISFSSTASRTEFSTSKQVWVQNGITITNNKSNSQNDVADHSNPVRFYAGSTLTIECEGMTKIEIDCTGLESKYVEAWKNVTGATATENNGIITITFPSAVNSFTYSSLTKQARAYKITVYTAGGSTASCTHTTTEVVGAYAATCTTTGYTGTTRCASCHDVISEGTEIPAAHTLVSHSAKAPTCSSVGWAAYESCSACSYTTYTEIAKADHTFSDWAEISAPTCTAEGSESRVCTVCLHPETRSVAALGHTDADENGFCEGCGVELADTAPDTTPDEPSDSGEAEPKPVSVGLIVGISVGAVVLVGAGVALIIIKKKFW